MRQLEAMVSLLLLAGLSTGRAAAGAPTELSREGRLNLGMAQGYLEGNEVEKAAERAKLALASDPKSANVHALLAIIYARSGDPAKAEREFKRALQIAPTDGSVLNAHASWLCGRGETGQADAEFVQALQDAHYTMPLQALTNAGKCAHQAAQWGEAEAYFRRALKIAPEDRQVLLLLADTELRQGKILEAQAFVQRCDSLGSDAATLELAATIEDAANRRLEAARYRRRLQNEFPNFVPTGEGAQTP